MEIEYNQVGKAAFQLKSRLQRSQVSRQEDSHQVPPDNDEVESTAQCEDKPETGNRKLRALFGRRRTHNEQIFVRPCGIVVARETFYGSETTPQVLVCGSALYLLAVYIDLVDF